MSQTSLQTEEAFTVKEYKHTHTHTHTRARERGSKKTKHPKFSEKFAINFMLLRDVWRILRIDTRLLHAENSSETAFRKFAIRYVI